MYYWISSANSDFIHLLDLNIINFINFSQKYKQNKFPTTQKFNDLVVGKFYCNFFE